MPHVFKNTDLEAIYDAITTGGGVDLSIIENLLTEIELNTGTVSKVDGVSTICSDMRYQLVQINGWCDAIYNLLLSELPDISTILDTYLPSIDANVTELNNRLYPARSDTTVIQGPSTLSAAASVTAALLLVPASSRLVQNQVIRLPTGQYRAIITYTI